MNHKCRKCGVALVAGENCTQCGIDRRDYICRTCKGEYNHEYNHRTGRYQPRIYQSENPKCRKCGVKLIVGENCTQSRIDHCAYLCRTCNNKNDNVSAYHTGRRQPMSENRSCSAFLGVHVAQRVLSRVFKDVEPAPYGNAGAGYTFSCNKGKKIAVKSSCIHLREGLVKHWEFQILKNKLADYFLCLAFDNRDDLNPLHVWLIPGNDANDHITVGISETTLSRWDKYRLDVDKVSACCNVLRGE